MATGVRCESRIESVTVYARGASVRRRAALPADLPDGACDVILCGVTALADAGSLRASIDGAREVLGVRAQLVVPDRPAADGSPSAKVEALLRQREHLVAARDHAVWRRDLLASVQPEPDLVRRVSAIDPADRVADALAIVGLAGDEMAALDARIADLTAEMEKNEREGFAAMVEESQASAAHAKADAPPELCVIVHLGPKRGDAVPSALEIEYAVSAARWWPAYRARFTESATRVSLAISALVAQASGEDWAGVRLLLSTGDLLRDVRLPELTSLRLGRAQRPRARGYRAPPEGLDAMFDGFDRFVAQVSVTATTTLTTSSTVSVTAAAAPAGATAPWSELAESPADEYDEPTAVAQIRDLAAKTKIDPKARFGKTPPGFGGGPEQAEARQRNAPMAPMAAGAIMPQQAMTTRGTLAPEKKKARALFDTGGKARERDEEEATLGGLEPDALDSLPIEPADAWLDFDLLRLDPGAPRGRRGRLAREAGPSAALALSAAQAIELLEAPAGTTDPRASRGLFDAVYAAAGTADVPSSGRPHRVAVAGADAASTPRFVTVPREAPEVYRRADVANPFGVPLLTGPVEVLIDGALVALTRLSYTDRGGVISIGLGVEERVRVARNTRTEEGTAGLLGGSTTVDHTVTTELSSSLGRKITVEVLDRIPVSDEKDVEIKVLSSQPQPVPYTQADLGQPVRRGQRWEIEVPAGGKAKIEHRYRITLPSKMEIVGGNRRE